MAAPGADAGQAAKARQGKQGAGETVIARKLVDVGYFGKVEFGAVALVEPEATIVILKDEFVLHAVFGIKIADADFLAVLRLDDEAVAVAGNGCNVARRQAQRDDAGFGKFDMIQRGLRDLAALLGRDCRWHVPCSVTDFTVRRGGHLRVGEDAQNATAATAPEAARIRLAVYIGESGRSHPSPNPCPLCIQLVYRLLYSVSCAPKIVP
ncbi:hypothetical protein L611_002700000090 [Aminobacter sp. J15]|nr:hypothetical protein L611_002700000090 [Aminobacter sp. J15]